jgi:O-succinylbenzoate synthase
VDAAVIGVDDAEWGRRPVAFVVGEDVSETEIGRRLEHRLARFQRPDSVFVLDELPATAIGKVDTHRLRAMWDRRLDVREVHLYRISQPLKTPFVNSQVTMTDRESIIVEVVDHQGRSGFGECVAFSTPWYTPETVEGAWRVLANELAPSVLKTTYLHPGDVFASLSGVCDNLMAKGSIEPACWDLYGRITGEPMRVLLGATASRVLAGVSLGILPLDETLDEIRRYVAKGYTRVKLKIAPGDDVERMSRIRAEFPDLMLMVDANQGYSTEQVDVLRGLDPLGLVCIEEPLANATPRELNALQARLSTPICVDETIKTERDLQAVLLEPDLRNINLKIGKFGGVTPSLELYRECRKRGIVLWLGGMYETGVSKYLHASFETLDGFDVPGDISETARYFERDLVVPEVRVVNGEIVLPGGAGLAFELDRERIRELSTDHICVSA